MFEKDERFQSIERAKDREDIFEEHLEELKKKVFALNPILKII